MSFLRVLRATSRKKLILISATEERAGPRSGTGFGLGPLVPPGARAGQGRAAAAAECQEREGPRGHVAGGDRGTQGVGRPGGGCVSQAPPPPPQPHARPLFLECSLYIAFGITTAGFLYGEGLSGRCPPVPALCVTSCTRRETVILLAPCGVFPCFVTT